MNSNLVDYIWFMCIKIYPVVSIKHEFILNPEQKIKSDIFFTIIYNLMISSRLRLLFIIN